MSEAKEVQLTELEVAKLKANNEAMTNLRRQLQEAQKRLMEHQQAQQALANQILERAGIDPEEAADLNKWNLSKVQWQQFQGIAQIPVNGEGPETAQPHSQKEEE